MANMENKETIAKLVNGMKWVGFVLRIIFYVIIFILCPLLAFIFLDSEDPEEHKSDEDLMREWMEREKNK